MADVRRFKNCLSILNVTVGWETLPESAPINKQKCLTLPYQGVAAFFMRSTRRNWQNRRQIAGRNPTKTYKFGGAGRTRGK
jgi:hypothetical protein